MLFDRKSCKMMLLEKKVFSFWLIITVLIGGLLTACGVNQDTSLINILKSNPDVSRLDLLLAKEGNKLDWQAFDEAEALARGSVILEASNGDILSVMLYGRSVASVVYLTGRIRVDMTDEIVFLTDLVDGDETNETIIAYGPWLGTESLQSITSIGLQTLPVQRYEYSTQKSLLYYEVGGSCIYVDNVRGVEKRAVYDVTVYRRRVDIRGDWEFYRNYTSYGSWFCALG